MYVVWAIYRAITEMPIWSSCAADLRHAGMPEAEVNLVCFGRIKRFSSSRLVQLFIKAKGGSTLY